MKSETQKHVTNSPFREPSKYTRTLTLGLHVCTNSKTGHKPAPEWKQTRAPAEVACQNEALGSLVFPQNALDSNLQDALKVVLEETRFHQSTTNRPTPFQTGSGRTSPRVRTPASSGMHMLASGLLQGCGCQTLRFERDDGWAWLAQRCSRPTDESVLFWSSEARWVSPHCPRVFRSQTQVKVNIKYEIPT